MDHFKKFDYQEVSYYVFHEQRAGAYEIFKVYSGNVTKTITIPSTSTDIWNDLFTSIKGLVANRIS